MVQKESKQGKATSRLGAILATVSVEPVMLLDGLAYNNMSVYLEALQMHKVCTVKLNYTEEVCGNLSAYPEAETAYQQEVNTFAMINQIILSAVPLLFILFIGAWSDKYGRKVPLVASIVGHVLYSAGYLVNSRATMWPVECLLIASFFESLGGGTVCFLTSANSYISDVTNEAKRTARVGLANSIWFLGGPIGSLLGVWINTNWGYEASFAVSLGMYVIALFYILFLVPESHGPFADKARVDKIRSNPGTLKFRDSIIRVYGLSQKKKATTETGDKKEAITPKKMASDFFDLQRLVDSIKCVASPRNGHVRFFIFLLILTTALRRLGRGAQMFLFLQKTLTWDKTNYGLWQSYKNFITSMGSLVAVPILTTKLQMNDYTLGLTGAMSSILDYICYGLISSSLIAFVWIGPLAAMLVNALSIAIRAMISKFVSPDEMGKVSAVMGAVDGVMPMIVSPIYKAVYGATLNTLPGTIFFFGASANFLICLIFLLIKIMDRGEKYNVEDATLPKDESPVRELNLVRKQSSWLYDTKKKSFRYSTIILSDVNYSIEVNIIEETLKVNADVPLKCTEEDSNTIKIKPKEQQRGADNHGYINENEEKKSSETMGHL